MKKNMMCVLAVLLAGVIAGATEGGDLSAGKTKSSTCAACHGPAGISNNDQWPNLAGQKEQYIILQLEAFQKGTRTNPIMSGVAKMLSAQDIHDLAAYYSHLKGNSE